MAVKLEVTTDTQSIVEYHLSSKAAESRLNAIDQRHVITSCSITEAIDHLEIIEPQELNLTSQRYVEIGE